MSGTAGSSFSGEVDLETDSSSVAAGTSDADTSSSSSGPSLLDKLRAPRLSTLTRIRKIHCNTPPLGKKKSRGRSASDPKSVTPAQRVKEFDGEHIVVSSGKLFCRACREQLSTKRSVLSCHVKSKKHLDGKERLKKKSAGDYDIAQALEAMDQSHHPKGETLPTEQRVFRVKVVRTFLRAGVPLNKLDHFRELLEEGGFRLTDRKYMSDLVPVRYQQEVDLLKSELSGMFLSVIFDGTTRYGEAMAILIRYVDADFCIQQRLVRMQLLEKSMCGEEVARELISCLSTMFSLHSDQVLGSMRDRASVNNVAISTMKIVFPFLLDVGCFSHTLNHVGEKFAVAHLSEFTTSWINLFSHSYKAKTAWKEQTGIAMKTHSTTRWWSKFEVIKQVFDLFGDIEAFLRRNVDLGPSTRAKLLTFFDDPRKLVYLQLELATLVDAALPFVQATYKLEGDGPLIFHCYDIVSTVTNAMHVAHYPNVEAVSETLATRHHTKQQLLAYSNHCIAPAYQYYSDCLQGCLKEPLQAFKVARLFVPQKVQEMMPDAASVDSLTAFPFLSRPAILDNLKQELPQYLAITQDLSPNYNGILNWWKNNKTVLPTWAECVKMVVCIQPSSAAAERVFSLLQTTFGNQQGLALQDYIETSLMCQYNKR